MTLKFKIKKYIALFTFILIFALIFSLFLNMGDNLVYAKSTSSYYSNLSQSEIEDIFELKTKDIADPWSWIAEAKTYVMVEKDIVGHCTYWWNTPNLQMSVQNSLYNLVSPSGYGNGLGENPGDRQWLVNLGEYSKANTALKKYGFNIPSTTYVGERPLVTISIGGVFLPDNIWDSVSRLGNFIFKGQIISSPTVNDKNSLLYVAPRDYELYNSTFEYWIGKNWYDAIDNIKSGQILLSTADQKTGKGSDGKYWIEANIVDNSGLNKPNLSAKFICQRLQEICGLNYSNVAKNIILSSKIEPNHQTERIMPYDLSKMNSQDASMFKGVHDPRSDMQQDLYGTGYSHLVSGIFKSSMLSISGKLSEISVALNGLTNFSFMESIGFNPIVLWNNSVIKFLTLLMMVIFIFFIVKSGFKVLTGNGSHINIIVKTFCVFFIVLSVVGVANNKQNTYDSIKDISTSVFNLSNFSFQNDYGLSSLYGTGNAADKENVTLWMPYFNAWTSYNTNHTILDPEQTINKNLKTPEIKNIIIPKIDGVEQTIWSTILADAFTKATNYSGNIYRVVDHFIAPRISELEHDGKKITKITVNKNENYNGNIQSTVNISTAFFQVLILILIFLKVILFLEFMLNISMLLFNVALSITDKYKLSLALKELGSSMINIAVVNLFVNLIVWTSLIINGGFAPYVIFIFYVFLFLNIAKSVINSNSSFTPKFMRPIQRTYGRTISMFKSGVN